MSEIQNLKLEVKQAQEARDLAMYERRLKDQEEAMERWRRLGKLENFEATIAEAQIQSLQSSGGCVILKRSGYGRSNYSLSTQRFALDFVSTTIQNFHNSCDR